ncbi:N-acetylglucosamine-6-phosphate deacetylase [Pinibacter aurantiacus]|uniref:N-acetylglucosamine-6-phosphate deacetylase n=1 Tax=Pinibacter aurantiacus TaxID=2851599 RepID=A0A9E2S5C3_9BACT|nr:N-acetylglucosamine-6-phosphate deacetylase [Pinibacter aurantiacus]MBV4355932.1 N-acetylglucosamine-6-phosphate deacetylase [Pinibacter aurantiacus]
MNNYTAHAAEKIFTGNEWLDDHAIIVDGEIIKDVVAQSKLPADLKLNNVSDAIISPAFIDLQIYGANGKLLSEHPTPEALTDLYNYCRDGGAAFCMPTVATNHYDVFKKAIDAIRNYWKQEGEGVLGIHLEGPWINPLKRGAHIESLVRSPSLIEAKELLEYGKGVIKIITLAPEQCSKEVIDLILSYGIVISAGHSNATYKQAKESFRAGIKAVTHLYNAMSPLQHREPGLAGAAMDDDSVMASIIPDGYHVDYAAIRIAKAVMKNRLFVITDAVTQTTAGAYQHELAGDKYEAAGILSGSALTMHKALLNLVNHCGIEMGEAIRMCSLYPARVMGLDNELGEIKKGYKAKLVAINQQEGSCIML